MRVTVRTGRVCSEYETALRIIRCHLKMALLLFVSATIRVRVRIGFGNPVAGWWLLSISVAFGYPGGREFCLRTLAGLFNIVWTEARISVPYEHIVELNETPGEPA